MNEQIWRTARAVVWADTQQDLTQAQAQLWLAAGRDMDVYHHAIWRAAIEKTDYLEWERKETKRPRMAA